MRQNITHSILCCIYLFSWCLDVNIPSNIQLTSLTKSQYAIKFASAIPKIYPLIMTGVTSPSSTPSVLQQQRVSIKISKTWHRNKYCDDRVFLLFCQLLENPRHKNWQDPTKRKISIRVTYLQKDITLFSSRK